MEVTATRCEPRRRAICRKQIDQRERDIGMMFGQCARRSGGGWSAYPASGGRAMALAASEAPGVEGGELTVRVVVTATSEIEQ